MKQYHQDKAEIKCDKPKLYALILKYLSDESLESVQQGEGWSEIEENIDPQGLWKLVKEKHRVYSKIGVVVKLKVMQLQNMWQALSLTSNIIQMH